MALSVLEQAASGLQTCRLESIASVLLGGYYEIPSKPVAVHGDAAVVKGNARERA